MQNGNLMEELSIKFALRVIKLYKYLFEEKKEHIMSKQVYRSGTSIGANIAESKTAQSDADFINKLSISLKEANETKYWLVLLHESGYLSDEEFQSIENDINTIIGTLIIIIKKKMRVVRVDVLPRLSLPFPVRRNISRVASSRMSMKPKKRCWA